MPTSFAAAPSDAALLRGIGERDPEALGQLFNRHAATLLSLGRRILGNPSDAEDVLQEVFFHVWNHAERYDARRASVPTWLVLMMRSRSLDRLRSRGVVERTHEAARHLDPPGSTGDASTAGPESVFQRERRERVQGELSKLPSEQRDVLDMAFYQGLTQTEIAARTGLPLGTVKTRTLLAMRKLRAVLRDEIRQLL